MKRRTLLAFAAGAALAPRCLLAQGARVPRIGYLLLDPETGDIKDEVSRINHMFVGNFSINEQIIVAKDHMCECGYLPCA